MRHFALLPALALMLGACSDVTAPVDRDTEAGQDPTLAMSDGANGGNGHFYFLPPMVPLPDYSGTFDATLSPEVLVCVWRLDDEECGPNLEMYTMDTGPGSETVRFSETDELYIVNWQTDEILEYFPLGAREVYRIRVLVEGLELGFSDVVIVGSGKELKNYKTGDVIPLIDGHRMAIKFRIEEGWLPIEPTASSGYAHSCAVTALGDLYCWGNNLMGQIGTGSVSSPEPTPQLVVGGHTFISVTTGRFHTCGIVVGGDAYCWGYNRYGQLGLGSTYPQQQPTPQLVVGGHKFSSIDAGSESHTCAVTVDGDAYCWGSM